MKHWKVILATVVIFGAGVLSGSLGNRLWSRSATPAKPAFGPGGPGPERFDFLRRWGDRLNLTDAQREKIDRLVRESQERVRALWDPVGPKIQEEMRSVRTRIEEVLTPDQKAKFDEMSKDRFRRGAPPGSGPNGEQGPWRRREGGNRPGDGPRPDGGPPNQFPSGGEHPPGPPPGTPPGSGDAPPDPKP